MPIVNVPDRPLFGIPFGGRGLERALAMSGTAALAATAAGKKVT